MTKWSYLVIWFSLEKSELSESQNSDDFFIIFLWNIRKPRNLLHSHNLLESLYHNSIPCSSCVTASSPQEVHRSPPRGRAGLLSAHVRDRRDRCTFSVCWCCEWPGGTRWLVWGGRCLHRDAARPGVSTPLCSSYFLAFTFFYYSFSFIVYTPHAVIMSATIVNCCYKLLM